MASIPFRIDELPRDVFYYLCQLLQTPDNIARFSRTNKKIYHQITQDNELWKHLYRLEYSPPASFLLKPPTLGSDSLNNNLNNNNNNNKNTNNNRNNNTNNKKLLFHYSKETGEISANPINPDKTYWRERYKYVSEIIITAFFERIERQ